MDQSPARADVTADPTPAEASALPGPGQVYLQPKVALATGKVIGYEALFRPEGWAMGADGYYRRLRRRPLAERLAIESSILRRVCAVLDPVQHVSVNVSLPLLITREGQRTLEAALCHREQGTLTLELLETDAADLARVGPAVERMVTLGARIALDDFGKGHATMAMAGALPVVHEIKIDGSIVHSPRAHALVPAMVELALRLRAVTTAEHVDSAMCADLMLCCGVNHGQGFHYGKPVSMRA